MTRESVPVSVLVLREHHAPMTLADVARATAKRQGWSVLYEDVDAVLRGAEQRREVEVLVDAPDYRDRLWQARVTLDWKPQQPAASDAKENRA